MQTDARVAACESGGTCDAVGADDAADDAAAHIAAMRSMMMDYAYWSGCSDHRSRQQHHRAT